MWKRQLIGIYKEHPTAETNMCIDSTFYTMQAATRTGIRILLSVPQTGDSGLHHLLLQLEHSVHQCFGGRGTARHVNVHRHHSVTSSHYRVGVMVVTSTVGTRTHGDDPSRVGHLIVDLSQRRSHFVGQSTCHNHNIRLTRGSSENNTQSVLIVSWGGHMHHLHGTAGQPESNGPERRFSRPHGNGVQRRQRVVDWRRGGFLRHQRKVGFHWSWGQIFGRKANLLGGIAERVQGDRSGFGAGERSGGQSEHERRLGVGFFFCECFRVLQSANIVAW